MGLMDAFKPQRDVVKQTKAALEEAQGPGQDDGAVARLVAMLLRVGLEGAGPIDSAPEVAAKALSAARGNDQDAIKRVSRKALATGAAGGFVTGLGGFVTMPVSLPLNVAGFYTQAIRMVGAIAVLRGYDLKDSRVRTAVMLTLVGSDSGEILKKAGMASATGGITSVALRNIPPAALMVVNKAVGFHLVRGVATKSLSRFGRAIPVAGGVIVGGLDAVMMKKIAEQAMKEFPPNRS